MPYEVHFSVNQAAIDQLVKSPTGMVGTYIYKLALRTAEEARSLAPVKSGKLKSHIIVTRGERGSVEITANTAYAMAVHEGTKAHEIDSKNKVMKFPSKKSGGQIFFAKVTHQPAHAGNPFLVNALRHTISLRA